MKLFSEDLRDQQAIDPRFAFGRPDGQGKMILSDNLNPHLAWSEVPATTRSFALVCIDPDVPASAEQANQEAVTIPHDAPRTDFYHWNMINIAADSRHIDRGVCSQGVTVGGKQQPSGPAGTTQGLNDYTRFMAGSGMAGQYHGYDGPCPPWNDERLHHYQFCLYALDIAYLDLAPGFTGPDLMQAIKAHILDRACLTGTYTLNPQLRNQPA
ncbi:MAG: YbhB/YbcL family Raf kinase inhibitor-like protein [Wenzhouxiangellaceae bacterium]